VFGAPSDLLQQLRSAAGVPIYDGLAAATHSTAGLAELLGTETPPADRRRYVVQAVLLATIIRRNHCNPPIGSEKPRGGFDLIWDASHSVKDILLHVDATPDSTVRVQTAH